MFRLVLAACLAGAACRAPGGEAAPEPAAPAGSEEARARRLVEQLGDGDWRTREAATKELAGMGLAALPLVEAARRSEDLEVAMRAEQIIGAVRRNAEKELRERVLVRDLFFCGPFPFDQKEEAPLELAFPPEKELKTGAVYPAGEGRARWLRPFPAGARGAVDLDAGFGHQEYAVVYALGSVKVAGESERKLLLLLGSDDSVRVWLNGKAVHSNPAKRGVKPDEDSVEVALQPGWNDVLVKVAQFAGDWGLSLRLAEADRSEAKGLEWDPTRGGERPAPPPPAPAKPKS